MTPCGLYTQSDWIAMTQSLAWPRPLTQVDWVHKLGRGILVEGQWSTMLFIIVQPTYRKKKKKLFSLSLIIHLSSIDHSCSLTAHKGFFLDLKTQTNTEGLWIYCNYTGRWCHECEWSMSRCPPSSFLMFSSLKLASRDDGDQQLCQWWI